MSNRVPATFRSYSARRVVIMTALLLLLAALMVLLFCYWLGLLDPPSFLAPLFGGQQEKIEILPGDNGTIYNALHDKPTEECYVQYDVGALDAAALLLEAVPSEHYYMRNMVTYYNGDRANVRQNSIYRDGARYRVETYDEDDVLLTVTVCDGEMVSITDYTADPEGVRRGFFASDSFSLESTAAMPDTALLQSVAAGQNAEWKLGETALIRSVYGAVYYVGISRPEAYQTETVYISMEYAVPVYAQVTFDGNIAYLLTTLTIQNDFENTDDRLFHTGVLDS